MLIFSLQTAIAFLVLLTIIFWVIFYGVCYHLSAMPGDPKQVKPPIFVSAMYSFQFFIKTLIGVLGLYIIYLAFTYLLSFIG